MRVFKQISFLSAFVLAACTKGQPQFSTLDVDVIPRPTFASQTSTTFAIDSAVATIAVAGECDPRIAKLLAQPIGPANSLGGLDLYVNGTPNVTCANNGKFSFTLNSLEALGFKVIENQTYEVQLRGNTSGGISNPSHIFIHYSSPNNNAPPRMLITSGSTLGGGAGRRATSTHFQAQIRLDHLALATPATAPDRLPVSESAHFRAKIGAAASAD